MDTVSTSPQPTRQGGSAVLILDQPAVVAHAESLAGQSELFGALLARNGPPPLWRRHPSFQTLVRLVLEQQVSLASANAAYRKLEQRVGDVTPVAVLESTDAELKADGFSRQKASYVRGIAELITTGTLIPESLATNRNGAVDELLTIRGVGPWTAACFALFSLGLPDVWPRGDRALHVSMSQTMGMAHVPDSDQAQGIAGSWAPHRSTAARMLWHDYLGGRSYVQGPDAGFV